MFSVFGVPPTIAEHAQFLQKWAVFVAPFPDSITLPRQLNEADNDEDVAIETYAYLRQGRG